MRHLERGDFSKNQRLLPLSLIGLLIGAVSAGVALLLLDLIRLFTNLFFFGDFSTVDRSPSENHLGIWVVAVPVVGSLIIGLMARFGSEKVRGHGIPSGPAKTSCPLISFLKQAYLAICTLPNIRASHFWHWIW